MGAADIAADGGEAAAWILDEGAHDHIGAYVGGLLHFYKFTVAIVYHTDDIGAYGLDKRNQLADLLHREGGTGCVSFGALNGDQLGLGGDGLSDSFPIKGSAGEQINLAVGDAVLF